MSDIDSKREARRAARRMRRQAGGVGKPERQGLYHAAYLRRLGFAATTIIDAGVHRGTPALYKAFASCSFVLVDPQPDGEALLQHKPAKYQYCNMALGSTPGRALFQVAGAYSSFLDRTALTAGHKTVETTVETEVTTLDALIDRLDLKGPLGVKIDTEGYELEVLGGLDRHRDRIEFLICEASVRQRFVGSYSFAELVAHAHGKGFEFYNFFNPPKPRPRFYDVLFVRKGHPLLS